MKVTEERIERIKKANELLDFIANTDKDRHNPFFGHKKEDGSLISGKFIIAVNKHLLYVDPYTKGLLSLNPCSKDLDYKCSEGGVGQEIIRQLARFIKEGKKGHLNDYQEVWGWDFERTMKVRQKALEIGFIESIDYPHKRSEY